MQQLNRILFWALSLALILGLGCRQSPGPVAGATDLDNGITALVLETLEHCRGRFPEIAPAAMVPGSLLAGRSGSRLEELIARELSAKISETRVVVALSRENWFELRQSRPLSLKGHPPDMARLVENLAVFRVTVDADPLADRITARIQVTDSTGRPLAGIGGKIAFSGQALETARGLQSRPALDALAPQGLKATPFHSLEALSYSMVKELHFALDRGIKAAGHEAAGRDIRVMLSPDSALDKDSDFNRALFQELQQAMVSEGGMVVAAGRADFSALSGQSWFYNRSRGLFETDEEPFVQGSVVLMARTLKDPSTSARKVSLRALWRVTPLRDAKGEVVTGNVSGTYVANFAASAWFKGPVPEAAGVAFSRSAGDALESPNKGFD